jgi:hypothetical protein
MKRALAAVRGQKPMKPTTTAQEDIVTAGQRQINKIWEVTQAIIAVMVCVSTMVAGVMLVIAQLFYGATDQQIPTIFAVAFGTVIGFYFSRTNHQSIGGEGKKPGQKYIGR